jgi:hypothetical protein
LAVFTEHLVKALSDKVTLVDCLGLVQTLLAVAEGVLELLG